MGSYLDEVLKKYTVKSDTQTASTVGTAGTVHQNAASRISGSGSNLDRVLNRYTIGSGQSDRLSGAGQNQRPVFNITPKERLESIWLKKYQGKGYSSLASSLQEMEDGIEKDWLTSYAQKIDYDEKKSLDLKSYEKDIQALERQLEDYNPDIDWTNPTDRKKFDADIEAMQADIDKRKNYLTLAKRVQEQEANEKKYSQVTKNADFAEKSGFDSGNKEIGYQYMNADAAGRLDLEQQYGDYVRQFGDHAWDSLDDEEKKVYNYLMNTGDREGAADYLRHLEKTLQDRKGEEADAAMDTLVKEDPKAKALRYAFMANVGYDQHLSGMHGMGNMIAGKEDYVPPSSTQVAGQLVREDLGNDGKKLPDWLGGGSTGQMVGDLISTTANMVPSILASRVAGMVGGPVASKVATGLMMGGSAGGSAYQEMINEGYSKEQARLYGLSIGAAEGALEAILGGISSLGGGGIAKVTRWTENLDNALLNFALRLGGAGGSEALEEGLQEKISGWIKSEITHEDFWAKPADVLYSSLMGFLSGGMFEGPGIITDIGQQIAEGRNVLDSKGVAPLKEIAQTSTDQAVRKTAGKITDSSSAFAVGNLARKAQSEVAKQNAADLAKSLSQKGMPEKAARQYGDMLSYMLEAGSDTEIQRMVMESDPVVGQVLREAQMPDSRVHQRLQNMSAASGKTRSIDRVASLYGKQAAAVKQIYNQGQQADGTKQDVETFAYGFQRAFTVGRENGNVSAITEDIAPGLTQSQRELAYDLGRDAVAAEKAAASKRTTGKESAVHILNEDGSMGDAVRIAEIAARDGDNVTYLLEDGRTVSEDQLSFSGDNAVLDTVKDLGLDVQTANIVIRGNKAITKADTLVAHGIDDAFRYGSHGYSLERLAKDSPFAALLTEEMRTAVYNAGKNAPATARKKPPAVKVKTRGKNAGIYYDAGGGDVKAYRPKQFGKLEHKRESGVYAAQVLQKLGISVDFYFFKSYVNKKGERVYLDETGMEQKAPNGWYDPSDGSIHIDLNAGNDGQGLTLFTMAHELTHFIEQWSPEKYKVLADFLIQNYEKGQSMDELVLIKQQALSAGRKKPVSYEEAYSEVIADSMEAMLADGNVMDKLRELKAKDSDLVARMKEFFDRMVKRITKYYQGLQPESEEGKLVLEMKDQFEQLQQLFAEALADAGENFKNAEIAENEVVRADHDLEQGGKQFAIRKDVVDVNGKQYDDVVELEYSIFNKIKRHTKSWLNFIRNNLIKQKITVYNSNGDPEIIEFAKENERVQKDGSNSFRRVLGELERIVGDTRKLVVANAVEVAQISALKKHNPPDGHQWLDQNGWDERWAYVMTSDGTIYTAVLQIAKTRDGRNLLYGVNVDITKGIGIDKSATSARAKMHAQPAVKIPTPSGKGTVTQPGTKVKQHSGTNRQFSDRKEDKNRITMSMTDSERTKILKDKVITAAVYTGQADRSIASQNDSLDSHRENLVKTALVKIGEEFGVFTDYSIVDVDVDIRLSRGNLKESVQKEANPIQVAKLLPILRTAVENAVGIECHANRYFFDNNTVMFENMIGGFVESNYFVPVRFGLKHSVSGKATLYLIVDQEKIETNKIKAEVAKATVMHKHHADNTSRSAFNISLASIIPFVNSKDLLRYLPDDMLTKQQKNAKWEAIAETIVYTNNKNDRKYYEFIRSGNLNAARLMIQQAAKLSGYTRIFYHGAKKGGGFTRFREWSYFTENKQYAERYAQRDNPGSLYTVYGKIKNPFDTRDSKAKAIFDDIRSEYGLSELQDTGLPDWTDGYDITDYIDENNLNYDSVILDEGGDLVDGKPVSRGLSYVIRNSEQVKSAEVITYDDDGNIIPISQRFDEGNKDIRYQDRSAGTSNRGLLVNAMESTTQDEAELTKLREYRLSIEHLDKQESKLAEIRAEIREMSFGKGPRDTAKLKELQEKATKIANEINRADKKLLQMEAAEPLQKVLDREKSKAYGRAQKHGKQVMENYRDRRDRTVMRHKIERVVNELNNLLTKPTKTRHVLPGLQKPVAEMLEALNMGSDEKQEQVYMQIARYQELLAKEKSQPEPQLEVIEAYKAKIEKLQNRGAKLSDNIARLKNAYAEIKKSTDPEVAGAYMPEIEEQLEIMREEVGDTPLQDMSLQQMDIVYTAYKIVLHNVTHANHLFGKLKKITAAEMTKEACTQMRSNGINTKDPPKLLKDIASKVNEMSWQNLRPVDAFRRTGSEKMMELFWGLVDGMAERGQMTREIRDYMVKARKDTRYSKFDFKKADTYTTVDGKKMRLTLGEKMSIYAYSKREAAFYHMTEGGFTYAKAQTYKDENGVTRYHNNAGGTWKLTREDLDAICNSLTEEQRRYADTMQRFLTEFGQRGNGVSRALFGIDLFKEQNYFPLMSNHDYLNSVQTDLGATQTAASLKNSGFTKSTKPGANNPIVLKNFDDVCMEHLDKMMNYIALTLPLENLRKVYDNVSSATPESDPQSTKALIGAVYGEEAKQYFDQFLKDANGTHGMSGAKNPLAKLFSKSKAAAVSANVSVVIQQISAVVRASAEISPIHLIYARGYGKGTTRGKKSYEEMMTYSGLANIKDMGGFDVGSNTGLNDYIGLEEAPRSAKKIWGQFQDIFGMGAEFMDKVGWTMIWNAVKREVASRKQYTINSKEFYEACSDRFNEIVVKTQVFDSVLSRSGYMRSDRDSVKYLTSFMGEPTVTAGMVFNTHAEVLRAVKNKKDVGYHIRKLARTDAALIVTLLLNGMLKAIPYALRDDDEDESFQERWAKHFGDSLRGDLNPLNLLPVARDISSIWQGRTVERPDLALVSDLIAAGQKAVDALTDEEKREEMSAEDYFVLAEDLLGAVGNMAGVPIQNIWRDVESYLRAWKDATDGIEAVEMKESFVRGFTGEEETKLEGIYDALISGDTARQEALRATYKSESSYESAVRKALRLHDPRIKEMANASYEGDYDRLEALSYEIEAEGIFDFDVIKPAYEAEMAAQAEERGLKEEETASEKADINTVFTMDEYYRAIRSGNDDGIKTAYDALIEEKKDHEYYLQHEAEDSIASSVTSKVKGEYLDEDISRADVKSILTKYGGKSNAEAETEIKKWEFQMEYHYAWGSRDRCYRSGTITRSKLVSAVMDIEGASREEAQEYVDFLELEMRNEKVDISASEASSYFEHAKPNGISVDIYLSYRNKAASIQSDKDENGKTISGSRKNKLLDVIHALPISQAQKDALYLAEGWAESKLNEAPWH